MTRPGLVRLVAAGALLVLVLGAVVLGQRDGGTPPAVASATSTPDPPVVTSAATPTPAVEPEVATSAPEAVTTDAVSEVVLVAEDVVRAWQNPDETTRMPGLAPLVTPDYLALAETIDPTRVPQSPVVRAGLRTEADGQALVDVELGDGTALAVLLVLGDTGDWLGADVLPVETGDA